MMHIQRKDKSMKNDKVKKIDDMYKGVNPRSVELSFNPTGPIKSVAARTPFNEMRKEYENEEEEMTNDERYINGFHDFKLGSPACAPGILQYGAEFKIDRDITKLFPYINAVAKAPRYFANPYSIIFELDGIKCAIYPDHIVVARFDGEASARKFIARLIDYINDIHDKTESIVPNDKVYKSVPALSIFKFLPKTNCTECGYASCMAFAAALSKAETALDKCPSLQNLSDDNVMKLNALMDR